MRPLTLAGLHDQGQLGVDAVGIFLVLLGGSHLDGVIRCSGIDRVFDEERRE